MPLSPPSDDRHALLFQARMSLVYHQRMEWALSLLLNLTAFGSIALSSAAVVSVSNPALAVALGVAVAVLNAAVLAFSVQRSAIDHGLLRRQWVALLGEIDRAGDDALPALAVRFHALNADEPPPWEWLLTRCHHFASRAMGLPSAA